MTKITMVRRSLAFALFCALTSATNGCDGLGPTPEPEPETREPDTPGPQSPEGDPGPNEPAVPGPEEEIDNPDAGPALDIRPSNPGCMAPERPVSGANITLTRVFDQLSFFNAVDLLQAPGDNSAFYVLLKSGTVERFANAPETDTTTTFLDLTGRVFDVGGTDERGLLGMAFHPEYPAVNAVFVNYVGRNNGQNTSFISRIPVVDGVAVAADEEILLELSQPAGNHNGGDIKFGPDGLLYISFGDGGGANDQFGHGQRTDTLLGTILRIDIDGTPSPDKAYRIPEDNPFVDGGGEPEIFAYGLRNVWRMSFDPFTGALWAADVGQNAYEEVNIIENGGNYGWPITEGFHCFRNAGCEMAALSPPATEYPHAEGRSVSGGHVYQGTEIDGLRGVYVYGDFVTGAVFGAFPSLEGGYENIRLTTTNAAVASFGEDQLGNLYLLGYQSGIFRFDPGGPPPANPVPAQLSATGCVDEDDPTTFAAGVIPYGVNVPFWSDNAAKQRAFAIPDGTTVTVGADGDFDFPIGSVTMKTFFRNSTRIETRLLVRHDDGGWGGYVYRWRDDQSDADLLDVGLVDDAPAGQWTFPGRGTCLQCHTEVAGRTLGLTTRQLNRHQTYPQTGRRANQLRTLSAVGLVSGLPAEPRERHALEDASLNDRARTYLEVNCAVCHQPNGPVQTDIDLRLDVEIEQMRACNADPTAGDLEIAGAKLIDGSALETSILYERIGRRDVHGMPPLASLRVDTEGQALIGDWITSGVCEGVSSP